MFCFIETFPKLIFLYFRIRFLTQTGLLNQIKNGIQVHRCEDMLQPLSMERGLDTEWRGAGDKTANSEKAFRKEQGLR